MNATCDRKVDIEYEAMCPIATHAPMLFSSGCCDGSRLDWPFRASAKLERAVVTLFGPHFTALHLALERTTTRAQ